MCMSVCVYIYIYIYIYISQYHFCKWQTCLRFGWVRYVPDDERWILSYWQDCSSGA